jgi:N-acetylglutamate synthase-like GNAT family acetyltransferase
MTELLPIGRGDPAFEVMRKSLEAADLPTSDLDDGDAHYFACEAGGFGGLVRLDDVVLLRSIVVPPNMRRGGIGSVILAGLIATAQSWNAREAWLLTTTAEAFFAGHGFERVARAEAPPAVTQTSQFANVCPDSAALMRLTLK